MKSNKRNFIKLTSIFILFLFLLGCSNDPLAIPLTEDDKENLVEIVSNYYKYLDKQVYDLVFYTFTESSNFISKETRIVTLEELNKSINYYINLVRSISVDDVSYNGKEEMPFLYTVITVNYGDQSATINEVFYFIEEHGKWKIKMIDSLDRYIPYRAPDYRISKTI